MAEVGWDLDLDLGLELGLSSEHMSGGSQGEGVLVGGWFEWLQSSHRGPTSHCSHHVVQTDHHSKPSKLSYGPAFCRRVHDTRATGAANRHVHCAECKVQDRPGDHMSYQTKLDALRSRSE